jgi:hypothetical protein
MVSKDAVCAGAAAAPLVTITDLKPPPLATTAAVVQGVMKVAPTGSNLTCNDEEVVGGGSGAAKVGEWDDADYEEGDGCTTNAVDHFK